MNINFADSQQALAFLNPQLLRIEAEVYETRYPSFDYADFMFVDTGGDMWGAGSIFYSGDVAGKPEWFSTADYDMPYADVSQKQFLQENHIAALGYTWHRGELERAAQLGQNLPNRKALAASRVAESFIHKQAMTGGNGEKFASGFINSAAVPQAVVAGGAFSTKTPDQILNDVNSALEAPEQATKETYQANAVAFPTSIYNYLARTRIPDTNLTILAFLRQNNTIGEALQIKKSRHLETAGAGSTKRIVAYANEPDALRFYLPGPYQTYPAWQKGPFVWEVPGLMNVGGVDWRIPNSAFYLDGV